MQVEKIYINDRLTNGNRLQCINLSTDYEKKTVHKILKESTLE